MSGGKKVQRTNKAKADPAWMQQLRDERAEHHSGVADLEPHFFERRAIARAEAEWRTTSNPVWVWEAIRNSLTVGLTLPDWVLTYLSTCAARIAHLVDERRVADTLGVGPLPEVLPPGFHPPSGPTDFAATRASVPLGPPSAVGEALQAALKAGVSGRLKSSADTGGKPSEREQRAARQAARRRKSDLAERWDQITLNALGFSKASIEEVAERLAEDLIRVIAAELCERAHLQGRPLRQKQLVALLTKETNAADRTITRALATSKKGQKHRRS